MMLAPSPNIFPARFATMIMSTITVAFFYLYKVTEAKNFILAV